MRSCTRPVTCFVCKLNVFATPECTRQANDVVVMEFTFSLHLGLYIMCSLSNPTICCLQSFSRPQLLSALHTARPGPWLGSSWVIEVCWAALFEANLKPREQAEAIDCVGRFENSRSPDHCVFGRFQGQLEHVTEGLRLGVLRCFDGACLVWMTICGTVIIVIYFRCRYQGQVRRWPASIQQTGQGVAPCDMGHWLHLCTSMCGCTIH